MFLSSAIWISPHKGNFLFISYIYEVNYALIFNKFKWPGGRKYPYDILLFIRKYRDVICREKCGNPYIVGLVIFECYPIFNPSNAETNFVQRTRMQDSWKTIETLSSWYSFESSRQVLSDEYPFARVSVIFRVFCIFLYWPN